jgi:PAS domain S-box-containing protein
MTSVLPSLRVLYLEDNPDDADLTKRQLALLAPGMCLQVAATLDAAMDLLAPAIPPFDIVLTDLNLPDGSGLDLLAHIRGRDLSLAVVIITGSGDQEAAVAALKAGADDYLVKRAEYINHLPKVLSTAFAGYRKRNARRARSLRVLYAEPNPFDVDLTRRHLARHAPNIRLEIVGSGEEVLARLSATAGDIGPGFDVLLLDYQLPVLNSLEVVKIIRQEWSLDIPIVLVTGQGTEDVAVQALRLGVDDYLVKDGGYLHKLPAVLEKLHNQAELNHNQAKFRRLSQEFNGLLDAIPDSIMLLDRKLNVFWANRAAAENVGIAAEQMVGRHCYSISHNHTSPCESCPVLKCFESGACSEETVNLPDGRVLSIRTVPLMDKQGTVAKVIALKRDITEHKKMEMQYLHAQKMESIGTLAGGVAHDFNNILTVIVGLGELMSMQMAEDDKQRRHIEGILDAAERAASLTRQLLVFSRKQQSECRPVDLNEIVGRMEKFLKRIIGEDIIFKHMSHGVPLPILADNGQLEQVLMNLAVNARDAMPLGGEFVLRTERIMLHEEIVTSHGGGKPGGYALLTVSDTGTGIDKATLQRIFEPFFSTKEVGKGTGLGLSVVYGIIKQHEGFINVYSEQGQGSTFRIYLPLTDVAQPETGAQQLQAVVGGTETILLAEDDDMVRDMVINVLSDAGYKVIEAVDGEDAVEKFSENAEAVQLLLFDLIMPRMNGKQASDRIRRMQPAVKTIFATGYSPDIAQQKTSPDDGTFIVYKPVTPNELLRKVRNVLDNTL